VVDSEADPARSLVDQIVAAHPQTPSTVQILRNPQSACSLKCSSLIQVISGLDRRYGVVALLDTDVVPHPRWLRDMVAPLKDPQVGAATGNRWFAPSPPSWPNLCRYAWNAAAVVWMYRLGIAWGGSMALKRCVIDEGHALSDWSRAYGEDTAINPSLRRLGLRLEFVPSGIITERSSCDSSQLLNWVTRQLLSCRLHHAGWKLVLFHGMASSAALGSAALIFFAALALRYGELAVLTGAVLAAFFLIPFALLLILESSVRGASGDRNRASGRMRHPVSAFKLMLAVVLTQILYTYVLVRAATMRSVAWRGARYEIVGRGRIRLVEYSPWTRSALSLIPRAPGASLRRSS
ncbi:MAG TPA: glycosyltransferase, partial [Gammaproteobacteria bacterium]|nr:glycosyltransferase [Gammaproteobacteria bacterium]